MTGNDAIDFTNLNFNTIQTPSFVGTGSGGTLTVSDGTHSANIALLGNYLASTFQDGWTRGDEGWWDDWSAFLSPWGFELDAITAPVSLWHGLADQRCPPGHGRWLAGRIPQVTAHFPEDEDHTNIKENNRSAAYAWIRAQVQ